MYRIFISDTSRGKTVFSFDSDTSKYKVYDRTFMSDKHIAKSLPECAEFMDEYLLNKYYPCRVKMPRFYINVIEL